VRRFALPLGRGDAMRTIKNKPWIVVLAVVLIAGALVAGWQIRRALAEGVPSTDPLYVGGMLTDGGTPVDGTRDMTVRLYAAASGGAAVCTTSAPGTPASGGRFRIALDASCATGVHANPDLWMEVQVGTTTFPGRTKVGAVPYALESGCASQAVGALADELAELRSRVANLETGPGRTCPTGMVSVGDFCIDKYEASVWQNAGCTGTQYGTTTADDYPSTFPDNGNYATPLYACSMSAVMPARMLTWFQAQQACAASGKHLCTNEEWQIAVAGTYDPGTWPGSSGACGSASPTPGQCITCASGPRNTGQAGTVAGGTDDCISMYGAEDMIGNLWEWTAWWSQAGRTWQTSDGQGASPWPAAYNGDSTLNLNGTAHNGSAYVAGLPAAAIRGGRWDDGVGAGAFAVDLVVGPSYLLPNVGFRCCLGR
jgi:formylglycine-generating enzyme required for sulfatase activity